MATKADFLKRVLEEGVGPAIDTYKALLLDMDPKIRLAAANALMEVAGLLGKGAQAPSEGTRVVNINLTTGQLEGILHGLGQVAERNVTERTIAPIRVEDLTGLPRGAKG